MGSPYWCPHEMFGLVPELEVLGSSVALVCYVIVSDSVGCLSVPDLGIPVQFWLCLSDLFFQDNNLLCNCSCFLDNETVSAAYLTSLTVTSRLPDDANFGIFGALGTMLYDIHRPCL